MEMQKDCSVEEFPVACWKGKGERQGQYLVDEDYGTTIKSLLDPYETKTWEGMKYFNHENVIQRLRST